MPIVLTVDQRDSRPRPTWCPACSPTLADVSLLRAFQRTAGDEFQGLLDDPDGPPRCRRAAAARRATGPSASASASVDEPLPLDARDGRGPAYVRAREAVESAKQAVLARCAWSAPTAPRRRPRECAVAVGRAAGPPHRQGLGGGRPGRPAGSPTTKVAREARRSRQSAVSQRRQAPGSSRAPGPAPLVARPGREPAWRTADRPVEVLAVVLGRGGLALIVWLTPLPRLATALTVAAARAGRDRSPSCASTPSARRLGAARRPGGRRPARRRGRRAAHDGGLRPRRPAAAAPGQGRIERGRRGAARWGLDRRPRASWRRTPRSWPAGPRDSPWCWRSRAWVATPSSAPSGEARLAGTPTPPQRFIIGTFTSVLWAAGLRRRRPAAKRFLTGTQLSGISDVASQPGGQEGPTTARISGWEKSSPATARTSSRVTASMRSITSSRPSSSP